MSEVEQYRERTRGMNAMENAGAYGITYWTINDIHSIKGRHKVTDAEAEELLEHLSNRLHESMEVAAWGVLRDGLAEFIKERDE